MLTAGPVFVGGTGRSGTSITAKLIGAHPGFWMIPIEVRFITDRHGLCDLASGRTRFERFEATIRGRWWYRLRADGQTRGLHKVLDPNALTTELQRLREGLESSPWDATREFALRLFEPLARAAGAVEWVEMSPPNVAVAGDLLTMFPTSRIVHSVRDGRDVAVSVARLSWGPPDADSALDWWADSLRLAEKALAGVDRNRVLVVEMEHLIASNREAEYRRLCDFLCMSDDPVMKRFFDESVDPSRARGGRWRVEVPGERLEQFDRHYQRLVDELRSEGVWAMPSN